MQEKDKEILRIRNDPNGTGAGVLGQFGNLKKLPNNANRDDAFRQELE